MHYSFATSVLALVAAASTAFVSEAKAHSLTPRMGHSLRAPANHKRIVNRSPASVNPSKTVTKRSSLKKKKNKKRSCKASSSTTSSSASNSTATVRAASGNSTSSSSSSSSSFGLSSDFLSKNGIYWGYLPDEADAGGTKQTMAEINSWTNTKSAFYGYYAQAKSGTTFDGSQLLSVMDDLKSSGAIFQPAVMPTGGWEGLTASDNSQAVAIAKVMKQFTDEGIEVWLRFAHEVNWYQTDGTYSGSVDDFQAGWKAVADAMDEYAPDVKMFFTPNVASESQYDEYYPQSGRVDIIGIDAYFKQAGSFVSTMQSFHDKYTSDTIKFAIGETGLSQEADITARLAYVEEITSDATLAALPNFIGCSWFNFYKGYDFRIVTGSSTTETDATVSFFAA